MDDNSDRDLSGEPAIKQACVVAKELSDGGNLRKFKTLASGFEEIARRAQKRSGCKSRRGKPYNDALEIEKCKYPDLADQMKGPQFSAAIWLLNNWDEALVFFEKLSTGQRININPHSLRVRMTRAKKAKEASEAAQKKAA
jgi:hypothetical protein